MKKNRRYGGNEGGLSADVCLLLTLQDSGVLCDGAEGREDRGGGRAEARLHGGGQLPVDEPRAAGRPPAAPLTSLRQIADEGLRQTVVLSTTHR